MKALVTLLMITCALNCLGQDNQGTKFLNADGSQNAYFIDTLHIDRDSLVIVRSKKNRHFFAIRNFSENSLKGDIWNNPETYLYDDLGHYGGWWFTNMPDSLPPNEVFDSKINDVTVEFYPSSDSQRYEIVCNIGTPKYYRLVMVRGDAYNHLTVRSIIDGGRKIVKFKDEKAYYKLLMPIW